MGQEHIEEYLGAIYRLREQPDMPLPLSQLQLYFGFSPISIHEMIQKLETQGMVEYLPYRGVLITSAGESIASGVVRRHRIWERFLTDILEMPWDQVHEVAGQLEHAAPEMVTERLAVLLGQPNVCPHGGAIPHAAEEVEEQTEQLARGLDQQPAGNYYRVVRIFPEITPNLQQLKKWNITPGTILELVEKHYDGINVQLEGESFGIPYGVAETIRVLGFQPT
jgi:DtxR family transcriptional regulator, Mn-dependent transcriptional regulator